MEFTTGTATRCGGRYTSWFFERPENVTILGAQNTRNYVLSMEHLVKVGVI